MRVCALSEASKLSFTAAWLTGSIDNYKRVSLETFSTFSESFQKTRKRFWALIIFMLHLLSNWKGKAERSQCIWKTYSCLTEGSRNKGPAVLDLKANISLFLLKQRWRSFSWIPSGPQRSAPDGGMWLGARGNEFPIIREAEVAKHQHTFQHSAHVWSRSGTHLRSWGSVCRCGPRGTCRLAACPAISVPLPQRALCDWPAGTSWVSLLAPQRRLDHSWKGGAKME